MREKVRDRGRLEHILEAIKSIEEFHAQYTIEDLKKNKLILSQKRNRLRCPTKQASLAHEASFIAQRSKLHFFRGIFLI